MLDDKENTDEQDNFMMYSQYVIKQIVDKDDENTKQMIKDYVRNKYPNKNVRIDFLDKEVVDTIVELGISEYLKRGETKIC